ncbi:MAG: N-acetylmuramoyl-L-alanine amidase [Phycisphaerales bacterium]|nr:N-acetylmuramoyl-L-alanine amidase [Phycisphaerales bacterium]
MSKRSPAVKSTRSNNRRADSGNHANRRPFVVLLTLVTFITGTSALLLALSRPPLTPDTLYAVETQDGIQTIFQTTQPATASRWQYIYVHHSQTPDDGSGQTLSSTSSTQADHFVITNGQGGADGQIRINQRWQQQQPGVYISDNCISICLVGDFDRALPTNAQVQRLNKLVAALQNQLQIPAQNVIVRDDTNSPAGVGQYFPTTAFRSQLVK